MLFPRLVCGPVAPGQAKNMVGLRDGDHRLVPSDPRPKPDRYRDRILRIYVQHYNPATPRGLELQVPESLAPVEEADGVPTSNGEISSARSSTST